MGKGNGSKRPCYAVATSAVTPHGIQTVDGVPGRRKMRVLLTAQPDNRDNGIWKMREAEWEREDDFDHYENVEVGVTIAVAYGTVNAETDWRVAESAPGGFTIEKIVAAGGGGGEANTASNLGAGAQVYKQKVAVDLQLRSIVAADTKNTVTQGADTISVGTNEANLNLANLGGSIQPGQLAANTVDSPELVSGSVDASHLNAGAKADTNVLTATAGGMAWQAPAGGGGGEANTASNVGAGVGPFKQKTAVDLEFKSHRAASTKLSLVAHADGLHIDHDVAEANLDLGNIGGLVGAGQIAASAVTANELALNSVTGGKIATDAVTATKIAANAVGASEIATGAVGTSQLGASVVTDAERTTVGIAKGGTGQTTRPLALDALLPPAPAKGTVLWYDGADWANLGVGTLGQHLEVGAASAVQWATPAGGGGGSGLPVDYQWQENTARTTSGQGSSTVAATHVALVTGALTGTYRVSWGCYNESPLGNYTRAHLWDDTASAALGKPDQGQKGNKATVAPIPLLFWHGGTTQIVLTGTSHTLQVRAWTDNSKASPDPNVDYSWIEFWKVA